jgi:signal peptidase I
MIFDFTFWLVVAALLTGVIAALDTWVMRRRRSAGAKEPLYVEYARSFFPVILIVLVVRSFLFEPFRIPSDSMMPTLMDGDFIFVSKFAYGLRLPVLNTKIVPIGDPQRGDVIVFRKPTEPSINFIKRLVGLPGDHVQVSGDAIIVNGQPVSVQPDGEYVEDACYRGYRLGDEQLGDHLHRMMYCSAGTQRYGGGCKGNRDFNECLSGSAPPLPPATDSIDFDTVVPAGHYFFMGDNRDNSADSRFPEVGFVPEGNLVGKAVRIWLSWSPGIGPAWDRIGTSIK